MAERGATGFVGSAVVRALLADGHEVTGLVRDPERARALEAAGARLTAGDMLEPSSYVPLVEGVDAVVHAAQYATTGRLTTAKVRDLGYADGVMTAALADACRRGGKRLVYTSGCFDYGDHGFEWITEDTPYAPSPLGVGHVAQVTALRTMHALSGLDVVVVAPGFVYGPGGLFRTAFYDQARAGRLRVVGPGSNWWSCVHVDDLARAYAVALRLAPPGATDNVVDDAPLTLRRLVDQLTDALGRKRVGTLPVALAGLLLGRPLVESLVTSFRIRNDRARNELGWAPAYPAFADGLAPTLAALRGS